MKKALLIAFGMILGMIFSFTLILALPKMFLSDWIVDVDSYKLVNSFEVELQDNHRLVLPAGTVILLDKNYIPAHRDATYFIRLTVPETETTHITKVNDNESIRTYFMHAIQ